MRCGDVEFQEIINQMINVVNLVFLCFETAPDRPLSMHQQVCVCKCTGY